MIVVVERMGIFLGTCIACFACIFSPAVGVLLKIVYFHQVVAVYVCCAWLEAHHCVAFQASLRAAYLLAGLHLHVGSAEGKSKCKVNLCSTALVRRYHS